MVKAFPVAGAAEVPDRGPTVEMGRVGILGHAGERCDDCDVAGDQRPPLVLLLAGLSLAITLAVTGLTLSRIREVR